jgi:hypothetical protein
LTFLKLKFFLPPARTNWYPERDLSFFVSIFLIKRS